MRAASKIHTRNVKRTNCFLKLISRRHHQKVDAVIICDKRVKFGLHAARLDN
jgi:hypothetical protein